MIRRGTCLVGASVLLASCGAATPASTDPHGLDGGAPTTDAPATAVDASAGVTDIRDDAKRLDSPVAPDATSTSFVSKPCKDLSLLVCEDFETGQLDQSQWSLIQPGITAVIDTTRAAGGTKHALHVTGSGALSGGGNYMRLMTDRSFPIKDHHIFIRAFVYAASPWPHHHVAVMMIRDVLLPDAPYGPYTLQVYPPGNTKNPILNFWGAAGEFSQGIPQLPFDTWSCLEWELVAAGTRELHLSLNDQEFKNMKVVSQTGWTPPADGQVAFYFSYGGDEPPNPPRYEYWIDQIAISDQKIGCTR